MMAAGLDVLALVLAVLFLRETHPAGERSGAPMFDRQLARRSLQHPVLMKMCLANLLFAGSFAVIDSMLPLFGNRVHGLSPVQIGYMFTFMGLMSTLVQAFAVGRVSARFGVFSSVIAGLALFGVGQMFIAVSGSSATMVVGGFCIAAGFAIFNAPASTIVTTAVSPTERGTVLGIFQGAGNVGRTLTPLYSGWLFTAIGPAAPFVGASLIMVPAIGALWRARRAAELTTST
jgi:MFS family permease